MSLDRFKSGFLLYETPQGLVRVELSFFQRVYLLWTFRNFRQLSLPLLNLRQRALVNALFAGGMGTVSTTHDPLLAVGVIEDFVPQIPRKEAATVQKAKQPEPRVEPRAEVVRKPVAAPSSSPRLTWSKTGAAMGALSLCMISAVAWHRIQGIPGSHAQGEPQAQRVRASSPANSPHAEKSAALAEHTTSISALQSAPGSKAAVTAASITTTIPATKQAPRIHAAVETPSLPLASRPPLRFVYPVYPDIPTRGVVALTARVDSDGTVRKVTVVSGNRALAAAAVQAVRQWRYRPFLKDSQPVATETNVVISFISEDAISMTFPPSLPPAGTKASRNPPLYREESKVR